MSQLLRIILIHTHLPGVVEIQMDQHTNICGTNASGKTTLQRLVPVFFGELPNRVVPKTRKKFDEFYLPFSNSYLVYEYQREAGEICQVVLTRKSEGGLDYRFVGAPYTSESYLEETQDGIKAYSYADWASKMRQTLPGKLSPKISATSEYRSIIQNDAAAIKGSNSESLKLRRLAASFSLVSGSHKLRHIEKLVSAVHAKEGKMDTLKSMLAAIFEEDGVTLPTTRVRNTKAREWIQDMRQSMKLAQLEKDFDQLTKLAQALTYIEAQLAALEPLLREDQATQKLERADNEEKSNQLAGQLNQLKNAFEEQETELNSQLSKNNQDLEEISLRLNRIQSLYENYEAQDMPQLKIDTEALPLWREDLARLEEHYQLIAEQHDDLERQLEQHKLKLAEDLERLSQQQNAKAKQLLAQKEQVREAQDTKLASLDQNFQNRYQTQQNLFAEQLAASKSELAVLKNELNRSSLTQEEVDELDQAEMRLEQAQIQAQQLSQQLQNLQDQKRLALEERNQADQQLVKQRKAHQLAELDLQHLHKQLTPEQGSLRHFLRLHYSGWEYSLGKVLDESLLDRQDLQPSLTELTTNLYGLNLDLNALDLPDYAQDETAIKLRIKTAEEKLEEVKQQKTLAEKHLQTSHEAFEKISAWVDQAEWKYREANQNIDYARDARDRLKAQQAKLTSQRQDKIRQEINTQEAQLAALSEQQQQDLQAMNQDHQAQRLELKSDWQTELNNLDEQLAQQEAQLEAKRQANKTQLKELEQAFADELSAKGIDTNQFNQLKERQNQLHKAIKQVEGRQDELNNWLEFMQLDWQKRRPELLEQETQQKHQLRALNQQLEQLKSTYTSQRKNLAAEQQALKQKIQEADNLMSQLRPLLASLADLNLMQVVPAQLAETSGIEERLARTAEALKDLSQQDQVLNKRFEDFERLLSQDAGADFLNRFEEEKNNLARDATKRQQLPILVNLLHILKDQQQQLLDMGENIGGDLKKFFTVFNDINRRIAQQSRRLSEAVTDDLELSGISKSEVKILSTIDELGFWQPLKRFAKRYDDWQRSGKELPTDDYLNALADVVELIRSDEQYSIESLLRLELHLSEGGSDLVIKNDRQLLESSSHGMAYLILCKYLLAFTRLLRGKAEVTLHWPIDEIGTLAYHNVEKLFQACSKNRIVIMGAFPNAESDVLMLFQHRYLIENSQLKRIQPPVNRLAELLASKRKEES
ncbi:ATP-binding protein [Marinospirillum insulare]|uniref:ATP-binding protein n=1 Tax=Marinospirillum insulare TaxID=217169 RepID=A0ABQ5ZRV1_9GAMM|nr:ATP-binding protein [Marinospirillum insulare]GLR62871.1 ATP-binding protein [Marinospirillum insulare]